MNLLLEFKQISEKLDELHHAEHELLDQIAAAPTVTDTMESLSDLSQQFSRKAVWAMYIHDKLQRAKLQIELLDAQGEDTSDFKTLFTALTRRVMVEAFDITNPDNLTIQWNRWEYGVVGECPACGQLRPDLSVGSVCPQCGHVEPRDDDNG